jgi:hypothetical protein
MAADPASDLFAGAVAVGLGRIVALCHRSSTSRQIHYNIRHLCLWNDNAAEP